MKVSINRRLLDGNQGMIKLNVNPLRTSFVPKDENNQSEGERGLPEYVLVYSHEIPSAKDEPELHAVPHQTLEKSAEEQWLQYPLSTVIQITRREDDKFRREQPSLVDRVEMFYIER
jgi:hypothetical protein